MQDRIVPKDGSGADAYGEAAPAKATFSFFSILTLALLLVLALYPGWPVGLRLVIGALIAAVFVSALATSHAAIVCRCLLPALIGGICVEAYILVHESGAAPDLMKYFVFGDHYNEIFYSAIATLYAIITALALVKGIEDFDGMKRNITDEAYKVRAISEMTHYFDHAERHETHQAVTRLKAKLLAYAQNVASMRDQSIKNANLRILRDCQRDIADLSPEDENDRVALHNIMTAHVELGVLRSKRINAVGEKIPRYLIWALWIMAAGLILPFMAEPLMKEAVPPATGLVENTERFGQYSIIFLLGALNSFLLLMLSDISDPFDGFWKVNLDAFDELYLALDHEMAEEGVGAA